MAWLCPGGNEPSGSKIPVSELVIVCEILLETAARSYFRTVGVSQLYEQKIRCNNSLITSVSGGWE